MTPNVKKVTFLGLVPVFTTFKMKSNLKDF